MSIFPADDFHIERAALLLRAGELVAFATETVYGLGANALDAGAVVKIYDAKGRPAFNPLIVHVADAGAAQRLASAWNGRAQALAKAFWPGPLTLVVPKTGAIPGIVSAGLETVALRVPRAETAQKLLRAAQIPLAAPSANRSGEVSPTLAAHVVASLGAEIFVLDGGACEVGIESTVVDVSTAQTAILRPGSLSQREIEAVVGPLIAPATMEEDAPSVAPQNTDSQSQITEENHAPRASPGMLLRHYAPRAPLQLFFNLSEAHFHAVSSRAERLGVLAFAPTRLNAHREIILPLDAARYAQGLYAALHQLDASDSNAQKGASCDWILVEAPPLSPEWAGVRDRLQRAAK